MNNAANTPKDRSPRYVVCMKWGTKYGAEYVNRLYRMVKRHLTLDFTMVCLTDDSHGIDSAVRCYPLPTLNLPPNLPERGWNKLTTFAPTLYDLAGTALFLDLDVVIVDNIDALFTYPTRYPDSCLLYTSPSPRDKRQSRMPSSA